MAYSALLGQIAFPKFDEESWTEYRDRYNGFVFGANSYLIEQWGQKNAPYFTSAHIAWRETSKEVLAAEKQHKELVSSGLKMAEPFTELMRAISTLFLIGRRKTASYLALGVGEAIWEALSHKLGNIL